MAIQDSESSDLVALGEVREFSDVLRGLGRGMAALTRTREHLPLLAEAQADVLRVLATEGPRTPGALAERMGLARSTISNLVGPLTTQDLLERQPSDEDGRSVLLVPTAEGRRIVEAYGRGRVGAIACVMKDLDPEDVKTLTGALPALHRLHERIRTELDSGSSEAVRADL